MRLRVRTTTIQTCLLLLLIAGTLHAAARNISDSKWQEATSDKSFYYVNEHEQVQQSEQYDPGFFPKILNAIFTFFNGLGGHIILWLLVASAILFIVYKLFISSDSFLFGKGRKTMKDATQPDQEEEDLAATNWELLLQQAVSRNDTRLSVRYSYMWLLQLLQQRELIQYRNDKTNNDYYAELKDNRYRQPFRQLSRQYEYTWYGQYQLSNTAYNQYIDLFNVVKKDLHV